MKEPKKTPENIENTPLQDSKQLNKKQKDKEEPTVLLSDQASQRFRVKQFIGFSVFNIFYTAGVVFLGYLVYQVAETFLNPRKMWFAYKIGELLELHKWFRTYKIVTEEPIADKNVLFAWMPHSVFCFPLIVSNFLKNNPFKSIICGSRMVVKMPIIGSISQWIGMQSVEPTNFKKLLSKGQNISFVPGGFEEATVFNHTEYRLFNNNRKGFIKYGLEYGYAVHPVFVFNERKGYWTNDIGMNFRLMLNKFKFPGTLFASRYGFIPGKNIDIVIVVGKKIQLPKTENPSKKQVDFYFEQYQKSIQVLFDNHVDKYDPGAKLVFWNDNGINNSVSSNSDSDNNSEKNVKVENKSKKSVKQAEENQKLSKN